MKQRKQSTTVFFKSTWSEENDAMKLQPVLCYFCCKRVNLKRSKQRQDYKYTQNVRTNECYKYFSLYLPVLGQNILKNNHKIVFFFLITIQNGSLHSNAQRIPA